MKNFSTDHSLGISSTYSIDFILFFALYFYVNSLSVHLTLIRFNLVKVEHNVKRLDLGRGCNLTIDSC